MSRLSVTGRPERLAPPVAAAGAVTNATPGRRLAHDWRTISMKVPLFVQSNDSTQTGVPPLPRLTQRDRVGQQHQGITEEEI